METQRLPLRGRREGDGVHARSGGEGATWRAGVLDEGGGIAGGQAVLGWEGVVVGKREWSLPAGGYVRRGRKDDGEGLQGGKALNGATRPIGQVALRALGTWAGGPCGAGRINFIHGEPSHGRSADSWTL